MWFTCREYSLVKQPLTGWWFQICFLFSPLPCENDPIWRAYFSIGLKPPTSQRMALTALILGIHGILGYRIPNPRCRQQLMPCLVSRLGSQESEVILEIPGLIEYLICPNGYEKCCSQMSFLKQIEDKRTYIFLIYHHIYFFNLKFTPVSVDATCKQHGGKDMSTDPKIRRSPPPPPKKKKK